MIVVTGATGYVGRAIVRRLKSAGAATVAVVRNPEIAHALLPVDIPIRVADYEDGPALERALTGADDVILISSDGDARAVIRHHANAIAAAVAAGVRRLIFTGIIDVQPGSPFYFAPVYRDAESRLAASGIPTGRSDRREQ